MHRKKLFYIDCEEEEEKDQEKSNEEDLHKEPDPRVETKKINPTISWNELAGIITPQTLKMEGYIS